MNGAGDAAISDVAFQVRCKAIRTADFLSEEQKADILCLNATRFLRIVTAICAP